MCSCLLGLKSHRSFRASTNVLMTFNPFIMHAPIGIRTLDLRITNALLYQLSHGSTCLPHAEAGVKKHEVFLNKCTRHVNLLITCLIIPITRLKVKIIIVTRIEIKPYFILLWRLWTFKRIRQRFAWFNVC